MHLTSYPMGTSINEVTFLQIYPTGHLPMWIFSFQEKAELMLHSPTVGTANCPLPEYLFPWHLQKFNFQISASCLIWLWDAQTPKLPRAGNTQTATCSSSIAQASFSWETRLSCSCSCTTLDQFRKQDIQSGLAGDSLGSINISSPILTFRRNCYFPTACSCSFSSCGHSSIFSQSRCKWCKSQTQTTLLLEFTCP